MRLLKAKALVLVAVGLAWYAVGRPALLAKRAALTVIDRAIKAVKKRSETSSPTR